MRGLVAWFCLICSRAFGVGSRPRPRSGADGGHHVGLSWPVCAGRATSQLRARAAAAASAASLEEREGSKRDKEDGATRVALTVHRARSPPPPLAALTFPPPSFLVIARACASSSAQSVFATTAFVECRYSDSPVLGKPLLGRGRSPLARFRPPRRQCESARLARHSRHGPGPRARCSQRCI